MGNTAAQWTDPRWRAEGDAWIRSRIHDLGLRAGMTKWYDVLSSMAVEERERFAYALPSRVRRLLRLCA